MAAPSPAFYRGLERIRQYDCLFPDFTYAYLYQGNQTEPQRWQELPDHQIKLWGFRQSIIVDYQVRGLELSLDKEDGDHFDSEDYFHFKGLRAFDSKDLYRVAMRAKNIKHF